LKYKKKKPKEKIHKVSWSFPHINTALKIPSNQTNTSSLLSILPEKRSERTFHVQACNENLKNIFHVP
jgi:hypothetical protein